MPKPSENLLDSIPDALNRTRKRLDALIKLRWLAVAGVFATVGVVRLMDFDLEYRALFVLLALLALCNAAYTFWFIRLPDYKQEAESGEVPEEFDHALPPAMRSQLVVQILSDWLLLTAFLHFSGGLVNPFVYVFVLHMIIGVTMIERNITVILTVMGLALIGGLTILEYYDVLQYHPISPIVEHISDLPPYMLLARFVGLGLVMFVSGAITQYLVTGLRDRERKLYKMSSDLVELSKVKNDFLHRVTHELKSPVSAMISAMDALKITAEGCLNERSNKLIVRAKSRGEGLLQLIRDLLEIARITTPDYATRLEEVKPRPLLEQVLENETLKAEEKGIELKVELGEPPSVKARNDALSEVFSNLVSNAVRYTPENGEVSVTLKSHGEDLYFSVRDTGIGISEEDQKKLFSQFFRASNAKKFSSAGTGLGLAITKEHVDSFGGAIEVDSTLGEGTTFTVRIPPYREEDK